MSWQDHIQDVEKLYVAYYQRPADPTGLRYWAQVVDDFGMDAAVKGFVNSSEAQALYQGDIESVIKAVYNSAFGRDPETDGLNYWKGVYEKGWADTGTIVWAIINGAKGQDAIVLENKLTSAENFTKAIDPELDGVGPFQATYSGDDDAKAARDFLKDVDATTDINSAKALIVEKIADQGDSILQTEVIIGNTYTLTTKIDTLTGTSGNDIFVAMIQGGADPLQFADKLYGGDGTDILRIYNNGGAINLPLTLDSIEKVEVIGKVGTINISNATDVKTLTVKTASFANARITISPDQTVDLVTFADNTATINIKSVSGTENKLVVENVNASKGTINIESSKVTKVDLEAKGSNVFKFDSAKTATVDISGTGKVDIINQKATTTYDAADNSGGVTVEVKGANQIPFKFIGGSGTDVLKVGVNLTNKALVNQDANLQNVEKVEITATGGVTVDLHNQSEGFTIVGNKGNDTIWGGKGSDTITTGDGNDKVVFTSFNNADKITDFDSTKDGLYLDIGLRGTVYNVLPNAVYTGTKTKTVRTVKSTIKIDKSLGAAAAIKSNAFVSASNKTKLVSTINKIKNTKATGFKVDNATAIMFGYSKSSGKLYMFVVKDKNTATKKYTLQIVNGFTKTIATLGKDTKLVANDIHIF